MRQLIVIQAIVLLAVSATAQQYPGFSQYMYGNMAINPGAAGSDDMVSTTALLRQQWTGFKEGAPNVNYFNANAPFKLFGLQHGVGVTFNTENMGFNENLGINVAYAYRANVSNGKLGVGVNGGVYINKFKPEWKFPGEEESDPIIPGNTEQSETAFDLSFGLFYYEDDMYMGVSSTHINEGEFDYLGSGNKSLQDKPHLVRHYYIVGGYNLNLNENFDVLPSFLIESDGSANQFEINTNVLFKEKVWGGLSYRIGSAVIGMIGLELFKDVQVGYAYDFTTTPLREYGGGSQELMLRYCFEIITEKMPERYRNIRYLP